MRTKKTIIPVAKKLADLQFELVATQGTAKVLSDYNIYAKPLRKLSEGSPNVLDLLHRDAVHLVINTPSGARPRQDEVTIRSSAVSKGIPCITTMAGAVASVRGIEAMVAEEIKVSPMQEYHLNKELAPDD